MSVFLLILKIIGITLLSILGLLIAALLLILFLPFRYNITISNQNDDGKLYARVRVTWLLHFVNFLLSYYEELLYRLRITFITIFTNKKKEKKRRKSHRRKVKQAVPDDDISEIDGDADISEDYEADIDDEDERSLNNFKAERVSLPDLSVAETLDDKPEGITDDTAEPEAGKEDDKEAEEEADQRTFFDKAKEIITKITEFIFNIRDKIAEIVEKITGIIDNIDYYINAVNDERNKEAFRLCVSELAKILKSIRPRTLKGNVLLYREDPYDYGQMAMIVSISYPFISDRVKFDIKNEEDLTSFYIYTKGSITIFVLIIAVVKIYFNKDVKRMIKIFKRG